MRVDTEDAPATSATFAAPSDMRPLLTTTYLKG